MSNVDKEIDKILAIIDNLQPDFREYAEDDSKFDYWMDYACELDEIASVVCKDEDVVAYLNNQMDRLFSSTAEHHACTDVATTLEENFKQYEGVFKYE
jgi:hypothetical protein